ncbi:hypothetical protein [Pseudoalteromonas luteoviolacea]|uniref:hypothetical protein n=1 Tax=Pseudoalteromonas luteoviolacea TaxID=43657 RepID=UPI001150FFB3|nr:hypothetical protein [Pseudoalteromonas luteoviolacea]TQF67607.1 hypothetical protein FLM44_20710 [Pseudoalteromonas luteoviolacea]
MSKCSKCEADITFMSVLNSPNPLRLKCSNCKESIKIHTVTGGIAVAIIFALIGIVLYAFYGIEGFWLKVVLPVILVSEVGYFLLIKLGVVKISSN